MKIKIKTGYTIIELMIAVTLSMFLIISILTVFMNNKNTVITQNNVAKMQDDSRLAFTFMQNDIENAGFKGCQSDILTGMTGATLYNVASPINYFSNSGFIQGYVGTGASFSPAADPYIGALGPSANRAMDVLSVRTTLSNPSVLSADMANPSAPITLYSVDKSLSTAIPAIATNCYSTSIFNIGSVAGTVITPSASLGAAYTVGSEVYSYDTITYYVGTDNVLYRVVDNGTSMPLAYNVEKFSVLYSINNNAITSPSNVNEYVYANSVANFNQVVSVRIGLVIKSNDMFTTSTTKAAYSYKFNGQTITPGDGKIRKIYFTTIALRNTLQ